MILDDEGRVGITLRTAQAGILLKAASRQEVPDLAMPAQMSTDSSRRGACFAQQP